MIKQMHDTVHYTTEERQIINSLGVLEGKMWKKPNIDNLKKNIREQLSKLQNHQCAYCGFKLGITSNDEIEHIAPKGRRGKTILYPQFMFTEKNLVLSCHYCNSIMKKGTFDTISVYNVNYEECMFKIVHPYFDDPKEHYKWVQSKQCILIQSNNNSEKAKTSIRLFRLDSIYHSEERANKNLIEHLKRNLPAERFESLIQETMEMK